MTKRPRGMTMIEVLVVVAIIGVLAGLATPKIVQMVRNARVSAEVRTMSTRMASARTSAITRGTPHVVCIQGSQPPATQVWRVYRKGVPPGPPGTVVGSYDLGFGSATTPADALIETAALDPLVIAPIAGNAGLTEAKVLFFAYDINGALTVWFADSCDSGSSITALPLAQWTLPYQINDPTAPLMQTLIVRPDGTMSIQ